jgi:hypothetical protein
MRERRIALRYGNGDGGRHMDEPLATRALEHPACKLIFE